MLITLAEAAQALNCSINHVCRLYTGKYTDNFTDPRYAVETEVLCTLTDMDPRFMLAFLVGYDVALQKRDVRRMRGQSVLNTGPLPKDLDRPVADVSVLRTEHRWRYSHRRVAAFIDAEEKANGKYRASRFGGGSLLQPPDRLPLDTWQFRSALEVEGKRLPNRRISRLAKRPDSALPIFGSTLADQR